MGRRSKWLPLPKEGGGTILMAVGHNDGSDLDNPFDGEANHIAQETGATLEDARDYVTIKYLTEGDTRALCHWLDGGHTFGPVARRLLSLMLQPVRMDENDCTDHEISRDLVPWALGPRRRDGKKGRPRDHVAAERNRAGASYYRRRRAELGRGSHESVIAELREMLGNEGAAKEVPKSRNAARTPRKPPKGG